MQPLPVSSGLQEAILVILGAALGGIIGGGSVAKVLFRAMRDDLRATFAERDDLSRVAKDLDEWGAKVNRLKETAAANRELANQAHNVAQHTQDELRRMSEHIEKHLIVPIRDISAELSRISRQQAAQVEINKRVDDTLRDIRDYMRG